MFEITKPFTFDDLPTKPEISGKPKLSEDIQQTIALLSGWDGVTRRLIRCSPTGVIRIGSARAIGVSNIIADDPAYTITLPNISTSEVMIRACPDNVGRVFLNIGIAAAIDVGYPLFTGEWVTLSVNNLNVLQLYIETYMDMVAIIYTE